MGEQERKNPCIHALLLTDNEISWVTHCIIYRLANGTIPEQNKELSDLLGKVSKVHDRLIVNPK